MSDGFIPAHGGYKNLFTYQKAAIIYDGTIKILGTKAKRSKRSCFRGQTTDDRRQTTEDARTLRTLRTMKTSEDQGQRTLDYILFVLRPLSSVL